MLGAVRYLTEPFAPVYMQRALTISLILAVLAGTVGVIVQLRKLAFMTDALTHTVFPGIAIAFVAGQSLFVGAILAGALSAVVLTLASRNSRIDPDAFMALVLASLFSVGVIVVSKHRSYSSDLTALLFGRVLSVTWTEIAQTAAVAFITLAVLAAIAKELLLRAFDPPVAEAMGYRVFDLDLVVNVAVAMVVVAAIRAVGTALVVALLITPAATARLLCTRLRSMIGVSILIGAIAAWIGLIISYDASVHYDVRLAPGATIVVVLTAVFAVVAAGTTVRNRRRRNRAVRARLPRAVAT